MRNTNKKGFTIVELVIVVAVIAILAAVLIPTFSGVIRKANESKDTQLIKNLNTALAANVDGDKTMAGALAAAAEFGYDISKINAKANGNTILWDSVANAFCYLKSGETEPEYIPEVDEKGTGAELWIIADAAHDTYSTYLVGFEGDSIEAKHSLDVSDCGAVDVIVPANAGTVSIFTNGGSLTVNGGAVTHYGVGYILTVADSAKSAYVEKGSFAANAADVSEGVANSAPAGTTWTEVASADALKAALVDGAYIKLTADITPAEAGLVNDFVVAKGATVVIDLNGHNISATHNAPNSNSKGNNTIFQVKGTLTLCGEGTLELTHTGTDMSWYALSAVISVEGGELTLNAGVRLVHNGGTAMAYGVDVNSTLGETTLNINGAVIESTYIAVRLFNNNKTEKVTANLNKGLVSGDRRDVWVHNPSAAAVDTNAIVNIADSYTVTKTVQSADSFYGRIYDID